MKKPIEYLKESWTIYSKKENFIFFAKIMAILVIIPTGFSYLMNYFYPANIWEDLDFKNTPMLIGFIILSLFSVIIGLWVNATTYVAVLTKPTKNIKSVFKKSLKLIGKYFLISSVFGLLIFLGLILLIIPAIIFAVWFSFSQFLVLDKNLKIKESLLKSKIMVKGKFWKVLGRFAVFILAIFVVQVVLGGVPYIGLLITSFIAPLFLLPFYLFYKDLIGTDS